MMMAQKRHVDVRILSYVLFATHRMSVRQLSDGRRIQISAHIALSFEMLTDLGTVLCSIPHSPVSNHSQLQVLRSRIVVSRERAGDMPMR